MAENGVICGKYSYLAYLFFSTLRSFDIFSKVLSKCFSCLLGILYCLQTDNSPNTTERRAAFALCLLSYWASSSSYSSFVLFLYHLLPHVLETDAAAVNITSWANIPISRSLLSYSRIPQFDLRLIKCRVDTIGQGRNRAIPMQYTYECVQSTCTYVNGTVQIVSNANL